MSSTWVPRPIRRAVLARDAAFSCVYCLGGDGEKWLDHVIPEDDNGPTVPSNLVVSCSWCGTRKGVMPLDLFAVYLERHGKGSAAAIEARVRYQLSLPVTLDSE